jgi:hypothetical protein
MFNQVKANLELFQVVAGEGWFAIGNSAGFTNPLISPGINAGVGSAVLAATLTKNILSAPSNAGSEAEMQKSIQVYQAYSHDFMLPRLHQMNRYWYNMFRDHRLFEVLIVCYWVLAIRDIDEQYDNEFDEEDLKWLVGAGGDEFQKFCQEVLKIVAPHSSDLLRHVGEEVVEKMQALSKNCLKLRCASYQGNNWGRHLRRHGDLLQRVEGKNERDKGGNFSAKRCNGCRYWMFDYAKLCPVCGTRPHRHTLSS